MTGWNINKIYIEDMMKRTNRKLLLALFFTGNVLAVQANENKDENVTLNMSTKNDSKISSDKDDKFQRELQEFQDIQRESEYLKLKIKNRALMAELGIKDRNDIFDNINDADKKESVIRKKMLLLSTFKTGKGPEKASFFIPGRGARIMKKGDFIIDNVKIAEIKNGNVKIIIMPEGSIIDLEPVSPL